MSLALPDRRERQAEKANDAVEKAKQTAEEKRVGSQQLPMVSVLAEA
jgi:hypothetical protein